MKLSRSVILLATAGAASGFTATSNQRQFATNKNVAFVPKARSSSEASRSAMTMANTDVDFTRLGKAVVRS